jgi:hypothetical protein
LLVHPLCELGWVGPAGSGELGRGLHSKGRVRTVIVVLLAPVGDKDLGFEQVSNCSIASSSSRMRDP